MKCKNPMCNEEGVSWEDGYCSSSCKHDSSLTVEEFKEKYMKGKKYFDFDKFSIKCKKCESEDIEFGGLAQLDSSDCYYEGDTPSFVGFIVCKCHKCGNAFKFNMANDLDYV